MMARPMFPHTVDSTLIAAFRSCPQKFYRSYIEHWKPNAKSVHLIAGGAFASGIEVARDWFYVQGKPSAESEAAGLTALIKHYGDFECPPDSAKSLERMIGALEFYFHNYPLGNDGAEPITLANGRRGIEFSFAEPLPISHPVTGDPILYTGRSDMVATRHATGVWNYDEKTTSALGATWPRQWELRCFHPSHEILTRSGWKPIYQVSAEEEVMQIDIAGALSFVRPIAQHQYEFKGNLISLEGRRLSQLVTPNHRTLLRKRRGGSVTVLAEDLKFQDEKHSIPLTGHSEEAQLPEGIQRLIAAVQADGTLKPSRGRVTSGQGHREHSPYPAIAFKFTKQRKIDRLKELLESLRIEYTGNVKNGEFYISGYSLAAELIAAHLTEDKKFIAADAWMYGMPFLMELKHWDGWENQYYTKHKENADFVATVAALNDTGASVMLNAHGHYTVVLSDDTERTLKSTRIVEVPYTGMVYCLTVPSGYLLTRCNGNISVSGNSQFTGYNWALLKQGIKPAGTIVRGISILKTKYDTMEVPTHRSQYEIDLWEKQTVRDVARMIQCWQEGYWDYNIDNACTEYGGCSFQSVCKSSNPDEWLPAQFTKVVWDPLERQELSEATYEAKWGHVRSADETPACTALRDKQSGDGQLLGQELKDLM